MNVEIWPYGQDYKVYVEDYQMKQKLEIRKGLKLSCRYFYKDGKKGWDFIFPAKLYQRVAKIVKLPEKEANRTKSSSESAQPEIPGIFTQDGIAGLSMVESI